MSEIKSNSSISSIITTSYNSYSGTFFPNIKFNTNRINNSKKKRIFLSSSKQREFKIQIKKNSNSLLFPVETKKINILNVKNNSSFLTYHKSDIDSNVDHNKILKKYNKYSTINNNNNINSNINNNNNFYSYNKLHLPIYKNEGGNLFSKISIKDNFHTINKKPKDTTSQFCIIYYFKESKNIYLFIPNSKFSKSFNLNEYKKNIINFNHFNLLLNTEIPYNYKIRMLKFGNMPKCFTDTCNKAQICFKKKPINSNLIWHLYPMFTMQQLIRDIHQNQFYNHFPSTFTLGRKDFMYRHYKNFKNNFKSDYKYVPETFILPDDAELFMNKYKNIFLLQRAKKKFIVKPVGLSRGRGVHILADKEEFKYLCKISKIKHGKNYLISRYISNPHTINNKKYDLRVYVLISSLFPLKIYMYKEGLVRFATEDYTKKNYDNVFVHLTNYSINKANLGKYNKNDNNGENFQSFSKWSFSEYKEYFIKNNMENIYINIFKKIKDIIVKTIITSIDDISADIANNKKNSLFELYGFDILIDNKFNAWLIEVNVGPSMQCNSELDLEIKTNLFGDIINVLGLKFYEHHNKDLLYFIDKEKMKEYNSNINLKIDKNNLGIIKSQIYNEFDINNIKYKGKEYDNDYFVNGVLREFNEEKQRSLITDFEMLFPQKETLKYYVKFMSKNGNNADNIVTWQYVITH